jgi:hypothetical protein
VAPTNAASATANNFHPALLAPAAVYLNAQVEQPTKSQLAINLKIAKTIGIAVFKSTRPALQVLLSACPSLGDL